MLRDNRFRLVTLGRLTLLGDAGEEDASLAKRRFKLALLSVLAMARRPIPRDTLLEMFWGDQDEARARHSLSNALSSLRKALGQQAVTTRDADVAIATDVPLDVDALELAEAVEGREFARAVELYGGPFLEGVHVDDSPAFEQWVSRERRRLEALFLTAAAQHCAMLARARRWAECHEVAARWLDTEPLSHDAAIYLLNAIKAPGTRAAMADALEEYERLKARLSREFDVVPERGVRELAESLREQLVTVTQEHPTPAAARLAQTAAPKSAPASAPVPEQISSAPPTALIEQVAVRATTPLPAPVPTAPHRTRWWMFAMATAVVALLVAVVVRASGLWNDGAAAADGRKPVIAILVMNVRANDSTVAWLADGLPQMIAGKLAHVQQVEIVNPTQVRAVFERGGNTSHQAITDAAARDLARRVGATLVARGAISRDNGDLVLDLAVNDVRSGTLVSSGVLSRKNELDLADEAAASILNAANVNSSGPQYAQLETKSVEAYQHYMRGLEAVRSGRFTEYRREINAALALDSGFIPVLGARIGDADNDSDTALARKLRETRRRFADRASPFDQAAQAISDAHVAGEREKSEALARDLVRRYPRDPRSYEILEGILGSHGEFDEAAEVAAKAFALDSLAIEAGNGPCSACVGLGSVIAYDWIRGDLRGAAEWSRRWIRSQPDAANAWAALAWTYGYMQRADSALPLMQRAVSLSGGDLTLEYIRLLLLARRYATADSAISGMESVPAIPTRETAADLRSLLEREHGQIRASMKTMDRMVAISPQAAGFAELTRADNLRLLGDYVDAARRYEAMTHPPGAAPLALPVPPTSARAYCWHHALAADALFFTGDTIVLTALADTLERGCARSFYGRDWRMSHHVRGLIAMKAGRYAEAEKEFKAGIWQPAEGWGRTIVELAHAQAALGRPLDGVTTLRTAYATRLNAMGRYVPISELDYHMALLFAQAARSDSAQKYAAYARTAWREADPEIKKQLGRLP